MNKSEHSILHRWLERVVWGWTAFTTVFLWTTTNRGLWRPSISSASLGEEGSGRTATFWVALFLVPYALGLFYLHRRKRLFPLCGVMLITWHAAIYGVAVWGTAQTGGEAEFVGGTWGWTAPLTLVAGLSVLMTVLAAVHVYYSARSHADHSPRGWRLPWKRLILLALLTPLIASIFQFGEGYDWSARVATGLAVAQWLGLLVTLETDSDPTRGRSKQV